MLTVRRPGLLAGAIAVPLALVGILTASPAGAASDPIGLSSDGVSFSAGYPGQLFGGVAVVPGGTATRSFWVKNQEASAGNLAVAIRDVGGDDGVFISALSVTAEAGVMTGPTVGFEDVDPCTQILGGVQLAPGSVVRVDVSLSLAGTLSGLEAQAAIGAFDLVVVLRSAEVAAPDPCAAQPVEAPPAPPAGGPTTPTPEFTDSETVPGSGGAVADPAPTPTPSPLPDTGDETTDPTAWNTARLYQEYFVAGWLLAFVLGGGYAWFRGRRRERIPE
ncbi:hypothetical protein [Protaetiibacter mangrovi]|uniref:LPXTG cell wall anchor domain-containing protein n=1 Tax=Protaetiibacter mangrovi TaxID=2970926 RepID=A0ABT1ZIG0_9MICO|nr:hypothetical protein [Protaetiibacter mangrovi]MCS0500497.1 hypothetical protein [Protaetiibacter mangrovi]TPX05215.1 hypothetical protein FJ656_07720 [Schumannella luteola]